MKTNNQDLYINLSKNVEKHDLQYYLDKLQQMLKNIVGVADKSEINHKSLSQTNKNIDDVNVFGTFNVNDNSHDIQQDNNLITIGETNTFNINDVFMNDNYLVTISKSSLEKLIKSSLLVEYVNTSLFNKIQQMNFEDNDETEFVTQLNELMTQEEIENVLNNISDANIDFDGIVSMSDLFKQTFNNAIIEYIMNSFLIDDILYGSNITVEELFNHVVTKNDEGKLKFDFVYDQDSTNMIQQKINRLYEYGGNVHLRTQQYFDVVELSNLINRIREFTETTNKILFLLVYFDAIYNYAVEIQRAAQYSVTSDNFTELLSFINNNYIFDALFYDENNDLNIDTVNKVFKKTPHIEENL